MKYKQIIFDVDDTLIDFAETENYALHSLFASHNWPLSKSLQKRFHVYNQNLWRQLENSEITYGELSEKCFRDLVKKNFDQEIDGLNAMDEYRSYFTQSHKLLPGVKETLKFAKNSGYKLTILSNGEQSMQNIRLRDAGIRDYFDLVITSEEAKSSKPDPHTFEYFFSKTQIKEKETLFFGDGLNSDILGSEKYGVDSIWYNHRHKKNELNLHPLKEVDNYSQFQKILQKNL